MGYFITPRRWWILVLKSTAVRLAYVPIFLQAVKKWRNINN